MKVMSKYKPGYQYLTEEYYQVILKRRRLKRANETPREKAIRRKQFREYQKERRRLINERSKASILEDERSAVSEEVKTAQIEASQRDARREGSTAQEVQRVSAGIQKEEEDMSRYNAVRRIAKPTTYEEDLEKEEARRAQRLKRYREDGGRERRAQAYRNRKRSKPSLIDEPKPSKPVIDRSNDVYRKVATRAAIAYMELTPEQRLERIRRVYEGR